MAATTADFSQLPMIQVKNVSKKFRFWNERPDSIKTMLVNLLRGKTKLGHRVYFEALKEVDFEIGKGEFVGIMGRNGAGKSTLLKLISGIYTPSLGTVKVNAQLAPLIELGAGFHPELSGYENIFLNAAILGYGRKVTLDAVPKILEFSELGEHIWMPVKHYSSGMLVRLGFSVATQLTAPIILVDEVLAVGDAGFQKKCLDRIHELHREGRTIILVTHDPNAVKTHCNRCIVIDQHRKVFDGPAAQGVDLYMKLVNG